MRTISKESIKMKVFPKGQVVIPISLRKKYHINIGDQVEVISKSDGILLRPTPGASDKVSLTDQLFGVFRTYAQERPTLEKEDIQRAAETGFAEGWKK